MDPFLSYTGISYRSIELSLIFPLDSPFEENSWGQSSKSTMSSLPAENGYPQESCGYAGNGYPTRINISKGWDLKFEDNSVHRVNDIFAIVNDEHDLEEMLAGLEVNRNPYVARHTESQIFFANTPLIITRGFMLPFISSTAGQLAQSGLHKFWQDLESTADLVINIKDKTCKSRCRLFCV
ncbi:hypothetical protein Fcan01_16231 [Folsomia candida]|uniref:Uncharacterized protein n=1 Tax=Folsomia candida TaxID=158441 RepID=A0A226DTV5_FOLCA|nr:hypothetical protein Fcan01_16231 [Folsomia candida]